MEEENEEISDEFSPQKVNEPSQDRGAAEISDDDDIEVIVTPITEETVIAQKKISEGWNINRAVEIEKVADSEVDDDDSGYSSVHSTEEKIQKSSRRSEDYIHIGPTPGSLDSGMIESAAAAEESEEEFKDIEAVNDVLVKEDLSRPQLSTTMNKDKNDVDETVRPIDKKAQTTLDTYLTDKSDQMTNRYEDEGRDGETLYSNQYRDTGRQMFGRQQDFTQYSQFPGSMKSSSMVTGMPRRNNSRFVYSSLSDAVQKYEEYDGHLNRLKEIGGRDGRNNKV